MAQSTEQQAKKKKTIINAFSIFLDEKKCLHPGVRKDQLVQMYHDEFKVGF